MTAAEKSFIGLAKQTAKGTPNTTDADFQYVLFRTGGVAPNNVVIPLDMEVGGGAMLRAMQKVGVTSGGALDIIPRPASLGRFLLGALGDVDTTDNLDGSYEHVFTLDPTDQFAAPYFTVRSAPGDLWGEQFQDCRVAGLAFTFAGARFLEGAVTLVGGLPAVVSTGTWGAISKVDNGPQFLSAPPSDIELPTSTDIKVLSGSVAIGLAIPLDEQWIVGSYTPDDFDINQRSAVITYNIKITDATLYKKMVYDPAAGSTWVAEMFKEGDFKLYFESPEDAGSTPTPYSINFEAYATDDNVYWTAAPIGLRAGRQIIMSVTGVFVNTDDPATNDPIKVTLVNKVASY